MQSPSAAASHGQPDPRGDLPPAPELLESLAGVPLFAALPAERLRWVAQHGADTRLPPGALIAAQGDPADGLYVVLEGQTSWSRRVGGRDGHVVTLGPGSIFAELILLLDEPYPTTGTALTDVRLFRLETAAFWELVGAVPSVLREIVRVAAERSRLHEQVSQRLLTDASEVLHSSLDYHLTLQAVARMAVERIADFCLVDVVGVNGKLQTVAAEHADPAQRERLQQFAVLADDAGGAMPSPADLLPRLEWTAEVDDAWLSSRFAGSGEVKRLRALQPRSLIVAPLAARGATLGVLILATARGARRFDAGDAALAEELARRAALAVDNARLYGAATRAVRARDDVLGIVSHDLRNPVGTAQLAAGLLLDEVGDGEDRRTTRKYLEMIRRSMDRANRLIGDLLDVTQIEAGRLAVDTGAERPADLVEEACDAFAAPARNAGVVLEWEAEPGLPPVAADRGRMVQALGNLVANAVKFTPSGGRIVIRATADPAGVRFSVRDTGPGIPPEHRARLFDRFWKAYDADRRGAGLGLAIVQGIVAAHGGRIEVESVEGEGTEFHFALPLAATSRAGDVQHHRDDLSREI